MTKVHWSADNNRSFVARGGKYAYLRRRAQILPPNSGRLPFRLNTARQRARVTLLTSVKPASPHQMSPTERAMHLVSTNREALLAELDHHSEDEVRLQLAQKTYSQEKAALAQDWLR